MKPNESIDRTKSLDHGKQKEKFPKYSVTRVRIATVLVPVLYFAGIIPNSTLMPQYLVKRLTVDNGNISINSSMNVEKSCHKDENVSSNKEADDIQSMASDLDLWYMYTASFPALLACLFLGGYADVTGRKPLLLLAIFTGFLKMTMASLVIKFHLPLWVFYISHAADGLSGSWFITFVALFSTISDVNPVTKDRVLWIAILGVNVSVVSAIFIVGDGFIIDALGYFAASILSTVSTAGSFLVALCLLQETLVAPKTKNYNALSNVKRILNYFFFAGSIRKKLTFWIVLLLFMFSAMNIVSVGIIDALYQQHHPFCWSPFYIGLYHGLRLGGQFIVGVALLKILQRCVCDEYIAMGGLISQTLAYGLEAFVKTNWQFALVPVVGLLGPTTVPVVRATMSSLASAEDQGVMYSSAAVMEVVCNLLSSTGILRVYSATVSIFPGAVYLLMASFTLMGFLLFFMFLYVREEPVNTYQEIVEPINSELPDE